jgi:hypothetical protein
MLAIDTEAINELYTYGGEKGGLIFSEGEEEELFEKELDELASICLAAMERTNPDEPI